MAWLPVTGLPTQYASSSNSLATDHYIKFYESGGTSNPVSMATDSTGVTTLEKAKLNDVGIPISDPDDNNTPFIPYMEVDYAVAIYNTEADADADDTNNALYYIPSVPIGQVLTGNAADLTLRDTTILAQDDFDRSILFTDGDGFTAGAGPHVFTVTSDYTPTDSDFRAYKKDNSGIIALITTQSETATQFTYTGTLASTDTIFVGDDTNRSLSNYPTSTLAIADRVGWEIGDHVSYTEKNMDISSQATSAPRGLALSSDGKHCYVLDNNLDSVFQYDLASPWDISTGSYSGNSKDISTEDTNPEAVTFKPDGTVMYVATSNSSAIFQYSLSTAWDISTASYSSLTYGGVSTAISDMQFKSDGETLLTANNSTPAVMREYSLSTAWDISTASYVTAENISTNSDYATGIAIREDGFTVIITAHSSRDVTQYRLTTAWDITTAVYTEKSVYLSPYATFVVEGTSGIVFKPNGTGFYINSVVDDRVLQFNCAV